MASYQMQARSSTTDTLYSWTLGSADFSGTGYPGPGSPLDITVAMRPVSSTVGTVGGAAIPSPALVATSNIALTGIVTVDSVASNTVTGDVLATAQTTSANNGYWTPNAAGAWTRPSYYNSDTAVEDLLGHASGAALNGSANKGLAFYAVSGTTISGSKLFYPSRPIVEIDISAAPWNIKADGTDETAKMKVVFDYLSTLYTGAMVVLPPRKIYLGEYLKGITNDPQGCAVPLIPYVSIRGCGTWASGFYVLGTAPIHGMLGNARLNGGGGVYASYRDFQVINKTCSWHYSGQQIWSPMTSYAGTATGTFVRPVKPSNVLLKLTATKGTSGAYRPIGELTGTNVEAKMLGTAAYGHATVFQILTPTSGAAWFGQGVTLQVSTNGGDTWGPTVTPVDKDYVIVDLSLYKGIDYSTNLGTGVGVKISNSGWTKSTATTTNGTFSQPGAIGGTVTIPLTSTSGMVFGSQIAIANSGLYEVQSVGAGNVVGMLWVAYPSGGGTIATGRAVTIVKVAQPRVEVISAPTAENQTLDIWGFTGGPLGIRNPGDYRIATPATLDPSAAGGYYAVPVATPLPGTIASPYTDVTSATTGYSGIGTMVIRFHGGLQQRIPGQAYFTPIFGWSMESTRASSASNAAVQGTFITDGGNVWEVVEAPDAIRLDGVGFACFDGVTTDGGNCSYAISQSAHVIIEGNFYCNGYVLAAVYVAVDLRFGEAGGFANVIALRGEASFYGDGYGIIHSANGLGFTVDGEYNFQLCPAGWCYIAGLYGGNIRAAYVETTGGFFYSTSYLNRSGSVQPVLGCNLTTGYAGSISGNYFLFCDRATFNFDGVLVGGALAGFGGINTCNVTGTGAHLYNIKLIDLTPAIGHVTDLANGCTWRGYTLETQRTLSTGAGVWGASNIDMALTTSDIAITGGPTANGWVLHSLVPHPVGLREGQILRITNFTGYWGVIKHNSVSAGNAAYKIFTPNQEDLYLAAGGNAYACAELYWWGLTGNAGWYVRSHTSTDQVGVSTLVAGVATVAAAIKANSRIYLTQKTPGGTTNTVEYAALAADRTNGVLGSFKITALIAAGTINTADTSTLDWLVKN